MWINQIFERFVEESPLTVLDKDLFIEVRAYECFKYLHVGLISELKKKELAEYSKGSRIRE